MEITIKNSEKRIKLPIKMASGISRYGGLMFKSIDSCNLLFDFKRDVKIAFHSILVFFPFILIWLDERNNVLEYRRVEPFTWYIFPRKPFRKVLEIPLNNANNKVLSLIFNM